MPNIASALKAEISRLTRRELRGEIGALAKAVSVYRREIAALKRRARALEKLARNQPGAAANGAPETSGYEASDLRRFSPKGLRSQRRRLGISAGQCGLLVGASAQSVYNWEQGKARPQARHLPAIAALGTLGKKSAAAVLASRGSAQ